MAAIWNDASQATLTVDPSLGSTLDAGRDGLTRNGGWADENTMRWRAGDFDADGTDDVVGVWNDGGMATLTMRRSRVNPQTSLRDVEPPIHWAQQRVTWQGSSMRCAGTFDRR